MAKRFKPRKKAPVNDPFLCLFCGSETRLITQRNLRESLVRLRDNPGLGKDPDLWVCDNCKKRAEDGKLAYTAYKHAKILEQLDSIRKTIKTADAKKKALLLLKELAAYFAWFEGCLKKERDETTSSWLLHNDHSDLRDAKLTEAEMILAVTYRDNPLLSEPELADITGVKVGTVKSRLASIRNKVGIGCTKDVVLKRKWRSEEELLTEFRKKKHL
jgi:DNA-binding CsgD family transcriptional regulator